MLPLLAVLIFAIMGIAALIVDVGLAFATQARLASAAPTLALERARFVEEFVSDPDLDDPAGAWEARARVLLETLLGAAAIGPDPGTGLRLETVTPTPELQLQDAQTEVALRGQTPLLFGMAALLPTTVGADGQRRGALSLSELSAKRAQGDLTPQLSSGGLRGTGFAPRGSAAVEFRPIARVGAAEPDLGIPGLAPVALFPNVTDLPQNPDDPDGGLPSLRIEETGEVVANEDTVVGCAIDPRQTASLGPFVLGEVAPVGAEPAELAYAPVLEGGPEQTPCVPAAEGKIIGFLPVSLGESGVQIRDPAQVPRPLVNTSASAVPVDVPAESDLALELLEGPSLTIPGTGESG